MLFHKKKQANTTRQTNKQTKSNQSINQPSKQASKQINQASKQASKQSIHLHQCINQPPSQSINQSTGQPINQPTSQPVNQSIDQPINQSNAQTNTVNRQPNRVLSARNVCVCVLCARVFWHIILSITVSIPAHQQMRAGVNMISQLVANLWCFRLYSGVLILIIVISTVGPKVGGKVDDHLHIHT